MAQGKIIATIAVAGIAALAAYAQTSAKQFQNQGEYEIYEAVRQEGDAAKRLTLLNRWSSQYPDTQFQQERSLAYLRSYSTLEEAARKPGADAAVVSAGENAARAVLAKRTAIFSPQMLPTVVTQEQWMAAQREAVKRAHEVIAGIAMDRRDYAQSEAEWRIVLEIDPGAALAYVHLSRALASGKDMARYGLAIYYLAHALGVNGDGALAGVVRPQVETSLEQAYRFYHGDLTGLEEVKNQAALSPEPPPGWKIATMAQVASERQAAADQFAKDHPEIMIWRGLKEKLTAPDAAAFIASELKDAHLPVLKGWVVSQTGPRSLTIAVDALASAKIKIPEATLRLDVPLREKVEPGTAVTFQEAVFQSVSKDPYMVTMTVDRKNLQFEP